MGGDIESPLLQNDQLATQDGGEQKEGEKEETKKMTMEDNVHTAISGVLAFGGVVTMLVAVSASPGIALFIAGGVVIGVTAPLTVYNQNTLRKGPGQRSMINKLRADVNNLEKEISALHGMVDSLEDEVSGAKNVADSLEALAAKQGTSVNELVKLVKENEETISAMKLNLRKLAVEDVTSIVMASDKDGDMTIDKKEMQRLTVGIQMKLEAHGIMLNVDLFEKRVCNSPSISDVLHVCKVLLLGEDYVSSEGRNDDEQVVDYAKESDVGMFTIEDNMYAGSVDQARGNKSNLDGASRRRRSKGGKVSKH